MTTSTLANAVVARLERAGYERLPTPFTVASVKFEFTIALRGRDGRSLDLVLIVDTSTGDYGDKSGQRTRQKVDALSRALDVSSSQLVLTVILAGAPLPPTEVEGIARTCRVLVIEAINLSRDGTPVDEAAANELDDRVRVLLPLQIDDYGSEVADPLREFETRLPPEVDKQRAQELLAASLHGPRAVSQKLHDLLASALKPGVPA